MFLLFREKLLQFLLGCHTENGAFRMHHDGEVDIRSFEKIESKLFED